MKIYFTASIRGGRKELPMYEEIISLLEPHGTILTEQVADQEISHHGETELTASEVLAREIERLQESDRVIAEVTTPSLGVGATIEKALEFKKPVVCLYHGKHTDKLSAMIKGNSEIKIYTYENENDLKKIIETIFAT